MIRKILCERCGARFVLHPEDAANGWESRRVNVNARKPKDHSIIIDGQEHPLPSLVCDGCGDYICDGQKVVAVTMWDTNREATPGPWESDYELL